MIALRLLLGKTGAPSCTYESKCCAVEHDENERLRQLASSLEQRLSTPSPVDAEAEYCLQKTLDENTLQRLLIDQLQSQLAAQSAYFLAQQEQQRPQAEDYSALHDRIAQLESRLSNSQEQLAASVAAHTQAKAHITVLQQQRAQLVLELEQMEDGFHAEMDKVNGELKSWERDLSVMDEETKDSDATTPTHTRTPSSASSATALLTASLERAKSATRIWALEDEVDRVRFERDTLRARLGAGRANLMQLKRQASEVRVGTSTIGRSAGRGLRSESHLVKSDQVLGGRKTSSRSSDMQLNTRVRPPMRGEPLTPETSDDSSSLRSR